MIDLRRFDLNLVNVFEILFATRSVSQTARRLGLSQSAVSAALRRLRFHFGDDLFVWNGQTMVPTPKADALAPLAKSIVAQVAMALDGETDAMQARREFVVASVDYVGAMYGPALLRRMRAEAPNLTIDMVDANDYLRHRGRAVEPDLLVLPAGLIPADPFVSKPLYRDRYVCIAARSNKRVDARFDAGRFATMPQIAYSADPRTLHSHQSMLFAKHDVYLRDAMRSPHYMVIAALVAAGDCISVVPERFATHVAQPFDLKVVPCPVPTPPLDITLHWHPKLTRDAPHGWLRRTLQEVTKVP